MLLGEVLRAAADGGRISHVSLAFRTPGLDGRPTTEFVDTFGTAAVTSFREHLSGTPTGTVSLASARGEPRDQHAGGAAARRPLRRGIPGATALAAKVHVKMGTARDASYAVTAVELSQAAPRAPLDLRFTTSSLPLLDGIFRDQGAGVSIPALTLSVRAGQAAVTVTALMVHVLGAERRLLRREPLGVASRVPPRSPSVPR